MPAVLACRLAAATCACVLVCAFFLQQRCGKPDSMNAIMPAPNRTIKTENGISRDPRLSMADEAMHSNGAENKNLLPSVRGKRPPA